MALGLPDDPAQQKRLLIGVIPILLLFGYWYFLHGDATAEVESMQTRLESLETQNASARIRSTQGRDLEERLASFERHIDRLEDLVPRGEEVSQLLNQINQRAEQVGVEVAVFRPGQTSTGSHYNRRSFELVVYGTYHNIGRLLAEIGSLPRIITPMEFDVISRGEQDRAGGERLEASFQIVTYVLPDARSQEQPNTGATTGA
jgi:type IV pilus assembly protein PilO